MLIFKEIEYLVREVKERLGVLCADDDSTLDEQRLRLLMQLVSYVNSMEWLSHKGLREKVRVFLKNHYSYRHVVDEFSVSIKQAHKSISYANQRLRSMIGGLLPLIREGRIAEAKRELSIITGVVDTSSLFIDGMTDRFVPEKDTRVVLGTDCRRELSFLYAVSRKRFESIVAKLDQRVVRHILYILSTSDSTYLREKDLLWSCVVEGEIDVAVCIQALNDEFIYSDLSHSDRAEY